MELETKAHNLKLIDAKSIFKYDFTLLKCNNNILNELKLNV